MKLKEKVTLVFKNKEGKELKLQTTVKDMLERTLDDFYEDLETECNSSSCNNESQNFCDCGAVYEDYEIDEVVFNVPKQFLCGNEYRNKEKRCLKQCDNCQGNI